MSTWTSTSQFLGLRVSALQVSDVQDRGAPDQHPYLPAEGVAVGVARPLHS